MRRIAVSAAVLIAACAGGAAAQDRPAAYTNAEACLEANVDAAVAASSGAADAAEFLLAYLCAGPVEAATLYEANSALLESAQGLTDWAAALAPAMSAIGEEDMEGWGDDALEPYEEIPEPAPGASLEAAPPPLIVAPADDAPVFAFEQDPAAPPIDPLEGISVDPATGRFLMGENPLGPILLTLIKYQEAVGQTMIMRPPVFLRERAARLIAERRGR